MVPKALSGLLVLSLLLAMPVGAETFYVDALDGVNDTTTRDGLSVPQAFRTIAYASDRASAGDMVVVMPGFYSDIYWKDSVHYQARGRVVVTQHDRRGNGMWLHGVTVEGFEFRLANYAFWGRADNSLFKRCKFLEGSGFTGTLRGTRFEECLFANLYRGVFSSNTQNSQVDRCTFVGMSREAVYLNGEVNTVSNSIFYENFVGAFMSGGNVNGVEHSVFFGNQTDTTGDPYLFDSNNYIASPVGGSNKPPIDPNFLDPSRGLYFLQPFLADGVTPNPLVDGGSFVPEENRITHIGAFGVGVLADRDLLTSGGNAFPNWTVAAGEPDSGASFEAITETPAASLPVEFDTDGNLRLKDGATVATLRSNVMDLQPTVPLTGLEVVGVHYESFEDPHTVPRGQRRVIDHNRVDDGAGGVDPNRRRTIRMRGSSLSAADVLGQDFFEIHGSEKLPFHDFQYVQLEMVLRRDGV